MSGQTSVTLYGSVNYRYGTKAPKPDKDRSAEARFQRMQAKYAGASCTVILLTSAWQLGLC